jgi:hypothetical protein
MSILLRLAVPGEKSVKGMKRKIRLERDGDKVVLRLHHRVRTREMIGRYMTGSFARIRWVGSLCRY